MENTSEVSIQLSSQEKDLDVTIISEQQNVEPTLDIGSSTLVQDSKCLDDDVKPSKQKLRFLIPKNKMLPGGLLPMTRKKPKWELESNKEEHITTPQTRKTRWGTDLTQDHDVKIGRALALQTRAEQIAAQLESGKLESNLSDFTRSPSPPPIYDSNGQRINTREGRKREQLELERREAIGECIKLNPKFKPPTGYKPLQKEATLLIPVKDYPGYNFIGLILGPRGNTQKRMEMATGAKIAIRGKGAIKEGKLTQNTRYNGKDADGGNDDLHVYITSDSYEKIDAAVTLIKPLLTPIDELSNAHKKNQLRELAEMNGTVREPLQCSLCGDAGHRDWFCPNEKLVLPPGTKIMCSICGDGSHPTSDCSKNNLGSQGKVLDTEYLTFLHEIGDGIATGTFCAPSTAILSNNSTHITELPQLVQQENGNDNINLTTPMLITASGPKPIPPTWINKSKEGSGDSKLVEIPNTPYLSHTNCPQNLFYSCNQREGMHSNIDVFPPNTMESIKEDIGSQSSMQCGNASEPSIPPPSLQTFQKSPMYLSPFTTPPNVFMHPIWGTNFNPHSTSFSSATPWIQPHFWSSVSKCSGTISSTTNSYVNNVIPNNMFEKDAAYGLQSTSCQIEQTSTSSHSISSQSPHCSTISPTIVPQLPSSSYLNSMSNCEAPSTLNSNKIANCSANALGMHLLETANMDGNTQGKKFIAQSPLTNHFFPPWTRPPFCSSTPQSLWNPMLAFPCSLQYPTSNSVTTSFNSQSSSQMTSQFIQSTFVSSSTFDTSSSSLINPTEETLLASNNIEPSISTYSNFHTPLSVQSLTTSKDEIISTSSTNEGECEYERILALIGVK